MNDEVHLAISDVIRTATGLPFKIQTSAHASGGCIHTSQVVSDGQRSYFVKLNSAENRQMFATEAEALRVLKQSETIRVPQVIATGETTGTSFLVLEALQFASSKQTGSWTKFGQALANLHRTTASQFGWHEANFIGATPQANTWEDNWADFFCSQRLLPQFDLAQRNGYHFERRKELVEHAHRLLANHHPAPSLLHGDLWSGNAAFLRDGSPVIYDPASYYGDKETDLAFSRFFGGFPSEFYTAYHQRSPALGGFERRELIYNLYHVLNHANLFGGGYVIQTRQIMSEILRF